MNDVLDGGDDEDGATVHSIGDRAANGGAEAEELFPLGALEGDELTPQKLIKRGLPVEVTVALGTAEVPVKGQGLLDPEKSGRVLVTFAFWKNIEVPTVEEGRIVGWKIRQMLRPTFVAQANEEAPLVRAEFEKLLALDPVRAGALLDELQAVFKAAAVPA